MTPDEFRDALQAALDRHGPDDSLVFTFVSPGPHGLPIRPELLSQSPDGERVYGINAKQARKLIGLLDG